jgi:uncharacterized membrane protein YeaQ/YmgE (transglycosylase-associated protein family)
MVFLCLSQTSRVTDQQPITENRGLEHSKGEVKMNLIIYLIAGAIVGYVASRIMHTNSQQGLLLDIVVGVVGAFLAGYFISPLVGVGTINDAITLPTLLVSLLGAVVLLAVYKAVARR